jgi:hypothetical protein
MNTYYLIRGKEVVDEVQTGCVMEASTVFRKHAQPGDKVMICAYVAKASSIVWDKPGDK